MQVLSYLLNKIRYRGTEEVTFNALFPKGGQRYYDLKGEFMFAHVDVLRADGTMPETAFSCHLDTVEHKHADPLTVNKPNGLVITNDIITVKGGGVLGADDGAGIWLLVNMIDSAVPGRYFFFAGEESGGIGSKFAIKHHANLFEGFKRAIAFDRKGLGDVIVSQYVGDCCSPQFGIALADALTCDTYPFGVADGVYTDTAEMIGIIPECVNVSCGYFNEHSKQESLDVKFLTSLLKKITALDWDALPTVRNPKAPLPKPASKWLGGGKYYDDKYAYLDDFDYYNQNYSERDGAIDEIVDKMYLAGITINDLVNYVKETGDINLL